MPLLFSYGLLQDEKLQRSIFGRPLQGKPDQLPGFALSSVKIDDPQVVAETGMTHYANVELSSRNDSYVRGTLYELTDIQLGAADQYEEPAGYKRFRATLASQKQAWVYAHTGAETGV
jgi:hypothetical protein